MKKCYVLWVLLGITLLLSGCGSKSDSPSAETVGSDSMWENEVGNEVQQSDALNSDGPMEDYAEGAETAAYAPSTAAGMSMEGQEDAGQVEGSKSGDVASIASNAGKVTKEMLVYRGELYIDTLDFEKSVNAFKALIEEKGGFVETESYTDNNDISGYYVIEERSKNNLYSATVRVPSTEYEAVMNSSAGLGDLRSRHSNASNVTQQYGTYQSQLEVYETKYKRYLKLLEEASEDKYALEIENELFDIQLAIANLKSGITNIENDVAYSYIDITIQQVKKYEEEPAATDTFIDRLRKTCSDSWSSFLQLLEDMLFYVIMNIYYILILAVIFILIIRYIIKKRRKKAGERLSAEPEKALEPAESVEEKETENQEDSKTP